MKFLKIAAVVSSLFIAGFTQATPMASGVIENGSTYSNTNAFQFANNSTDGESIVKLVWDLSPINGFFDSSGAAPGTAPRPLTLGSLSDNVGQLFPSNASLDGTSVLEVLFSDFDAGELFSFGVDTDLFSAIDAAGINGDQFSGATVTAYFDNGVVTTGTYVLSDLFGFGTQVLITNVVNVDAIPEPASLLLLGLGLTGICLSRRKKQ